MSENQPVRVSTVINGSILLLIAVLGLTAAVFGGWSATMVVWGVVGFGGLLVVAGAVGAVSRAIRRPTASTDRLTHDSSDTPLP